MAENRMAGTALVPLTVLTFSSCRTTGSDNGADGRLVLPQPGPGAAGAE